MFDAEVGAELFKLCIIELSSIISNKSIWDSERQIMFFQTKFVIFAIVIMANSFASTHLVK